MRRNWSVGLALVLVVAIPLTAGATRTDEPDRRVTDVRGESEPFDASSIDEVEVQAIVDQEVAEQFEPYRPEVDTQERERHERDRPERDRPERDRPERRLDRPSDHRPIDRCLDAADNPRRCIDHEPTQDSNVRHLIWRLINAHEWEKLVRLLIRLGLI